MSVAFTWTYFLKPSIKPPNGDAVTYSDTGPASIVYSSVSLSSNVSSRLLRPMHLVHVQMSRVELIALLLLH